ncbi:MAG: heat-inducible transcriptional repressor HrcA [Candidatus Kapabacteria bacterium]|nr:heat-inducible transcriptional repressor HrcA [Candidatus Kapabacteria bacterium]
MDNFFKIKNRELSEREQEILRSIINLYILKASPVGSRSLSKYLEDKLNLSAASLRNIMSDLEEMDYISHPHTSAGRIPTDKGYRFYVDSLSNFNSSENDIITINQSIIIEGNDNDQIFKEATKVLGALSQYLSVIKIPQILDIKVQKMQLISLASTRLLVVLALDSNIVRTVTLEADFEFNTKYLDKISNYINERVSGKSLRFLRENFAELVSEMGYREYPLIRLFVDSVDKIFDTAQDKDKIVTSGTQNLINHPEFDVLSKVKSVIELVENEDIIVHLLDNFGEINNGIKVMIGSEMDNTIMDDYSIILSSYSLGNAIGTIGVIGPKRMNYSRMINLVQGVSSIISTQQKN